MEPDDDHSPTSREVIRKPDRTKKMSTPSRPPATRDTPPWKARTPSTATARIPSSPGTWGRGPRAGASPLGPATGSPGRSGASGSQPDRRSNVVTADDRCTFAPPGRSGGPGNASRLVGGRRLAGHASPEPLPAPLVAVAGAVDAGRPDHPAHHRLQRSEQGGRRGRLLLPLRRQSPGHRP